MTPRVRAVIAALEADELHAAADMLQAELAARSEALNAAGVAALFHRSPTPDGSQQDRALELVAAGVSQREIARRLGVPRSTVQGWIGGRVVAESAGFRPPSATLSATFGRPAGHPSATLGGEGGDLSSLGSSPDPLLSISAESPSFSSSLIQGSDLEERARESSEVADTVAERVAEVAESAGRPATLRPAESGHPPAKSTRASKTLLPADWKPSPAFWSWCDRERFDLGDVARELAALEDWARSNGRRMADWDACARGWVRRSASDGKVDRVARAEAPPPSLPASLRNLSPAELEARKAATRTRLAEQAKRIGSLFDSDPEPAEVTP